jgi:hypothetical protein
MLPYAVEACGLIRHARPDLRIVLGGPGPSATPAAIIDAFPSIDFVAFGEGEATAIELVETLASPTFAESDPALGRIEGLAWRDGAGRAIVNPARQRRCDLDDIPFPAYHHVRLDAYDIVGVVTTRGCPYACTYCDVVSMWKRRSIARSVENVIAEIEWLHGAFGVGMSPASTIGPPSIGAARSKSRTRSRARGRSSRGDAPRASIAPTTRSSAGWRWPAAATCSSGSSPDRRRCWPASTRSCRSITPADPSAAESHSACTSTRR